MAKLLDQRGAIRLLKADGWTQSRGGDRQASRSQLDEGPQMHLEVVVHQDGSEYWSQIAGLPGCFASGRTLSELREALAEAVGLYLWDSPAELEPGELTVGVVEIDVRPGTQPRSL